MTTIDSGSRSKHSVSLNGWLNAQILAGNFPKFGYPANRIPRVKDVETGIAGGFMLAADDTRTN